MAISMAMLRIATLDPLCNHPRRLRATAEDSDAAPMREDDPNAPHGPREPVEASQRRFSGKVGLLPSGYFKIAIENGYL